MSTKSVSIGVFLALLLALATPFIASAATLSLTPSSATVGAGNIFTVKLLVNTQGQAINSADAVLNFPTDLLRVVSISDSDSIFSLWVQNPIFSNNNGTISFTGGLPTPGFTGSAGNIINIVFQAEKAGTASVLISSGDVFANDGLGTDILNASNPAQFTLTPYVKPANTQTSAAASTPNTSATVVQFNVTEVPPVDPTDSTVVFKLNIKGDASTVSRYIFQIDNGSPQTWSDDGSHQYMASSVSPGSHVFLAQAIDSAGNLFTTSANFTVAPLLAPTITDYPKQLQSGNVLVVQGTTYPSSTVIIWLQKDQGVTENFTTESDQNGKFIFVDSEDLQDGNYHLWAGVTNAQGTTSAPGNTMIITVIPPAVVRIGTWALNVMAVIVPLVALLILLMLIVMYGWHKLRLLRRRIKKESHNAESVLHKAVDLLRSDMRAYVEILEKTRTKRQLTTEEEDIGKQFKKDIELAEKIVREDIEDIENEVR